MPRKSLLLAMMAGALFIVILIALSVQSSAGIETKQLKLLHVVSNCFYIRPTEFVFRRELCLDRQAWN